MTVNGNVTLNSGSTSLFEITPTAQDKLIVNGKVTIAGPPCRSPPPRRSRRAPR
jgi:hypothetical protein